ncbi:MAG: GFA family protein [Rubrivivax sp.]|nr:GFA family protein [Rubrivivax sp.]
MLEVREGGCLCGLARFRALGEPLRAHACHCTFCQRRTGSAYAEVAYFLGDNIEITGGPLTTYTHRSDASGRWLRMQFCPTCGTCVTIALERRPGELGIHIGTLDDPNAIKLRRHIWTSSQQAATLIPEDAERRTHGLIESDLGNPV